jgi:hypothetical protein
VLFPGFSQSAGCNPRDTDLRSLSLMLSSGHEANISLVRLPEASRRGLSGGSDIQAEGKGDSSRHAAHCPHTTTGEGAAKREIRESVLFPLDFPLSALEIVALSSRSKPCPKSLNLRSSSSLFKAPSSQR